MRSKLKFKLDDEWLEFENPNPHLTLLDYLRLKALKTGVKEGCNEGDCGACTVLIGKYEEEKLTYHAINSCIKLLNACDMSHVVTIHALKNHPLQTAFVQYHASQCGFCTPGFIMSLYALWLNEQSPCVTLIEQAIAGNLCRCTGYRPIVEAAQKAFEGLSRDQPDFARSEQSSLQSLGYSRPITLNEALQSLDKTPKPLIVAGSTDIGLWLTKDHQRPAMMLDLSAVTALQTIADAPSQITIGAGVSLTRVMALFEKLHPALYQLMSRFGGKQVRNSGTIGGNIGNGSPIGDLAPLLLVLNASLTLTSLHSSRQIKLEQFFLDYKMQDILPNELIEAIHIPKPLPDHIHIHKLSKRHDEDISTLLFALSHDQQKRHIRLAFGGMAAIPKRAIYTEKLIEKGASFEEIAEGLAVDYAPITDVRASREYRIKAAQNLLIRALS